MRKRRLGLSSNSPAVKTGFGRAARALTEWIFKNRPDIELFYMHQGLHNNDPIMKKFPYVSWGALTNEIMQTEQFQKDHNYQRMMSYGNGRVEDFVVSNELDNYICFEDIWAAQKEFYYKKSWFDFARKNTAIWTTLDSEPILEAAYEWARNSDNLWTWASFATRAMKEKSEELYGHVKYLPGCLDTEQFKPCSEKERNELREKFNIKPDETIFLHLGRNQLRKLFLSNLEALAKFKKQRPTQKAKLLFHCSWTENGAWNFPEAIKEFGLNNDDVLATYCCKKCGNWEVQPFKGDNIQCPNCNNPDHYATAGIDSTISEEDLSKIYSICDAASSQFTSGGLEYFNVESLLCGLPLLTSPYSSGEDFAKQTFVDSSEGTMYREVGTQFKKFQPNPNSIVKFFCKICDMSREKRKEIGAKGRDWALKTFDVSVIGKKICDWVDSTEYLDWSKYHENKKDYDIKNPHATIPTDIESDEEFVRTLYRNILKMDNLKSDDSGLLGWLSHFQNIPLDNKETRNQIRKELENTFRSIAIQENQKNNKIEFKSFIDLDRSNKRALLTIKESGGDCFIVSGLFEDFHKKYKGYDLYISCDPKFFDIFAGNPHVHKLIPWHPITESEMDMIGAGKDKKDVFFHVFLYPAVSTQKHLNYLSNIKAGQIK